MVLLFFMDCENNVFIASNLFFYQVVAINSLCKKVSFRHS